MRSFAVGVVLHFVLVSMGTAQGPSRWGLDSGAVVRMHFVEGGTQVGRLAEPLESVDSAILYCPGRVGWCTGPAPVERPLMDVVHLDVQRGTHAKRGALIGAGVGLGLVAWAVLSRGIGGDGHSERKPVATAFGLASVVGVPTLIGAVLGSHHSNWHRLR